MNKLNETLEKLKEFSTPDLLIENYDIDIVRAFLKYLGSPQKDLFIFHVGGTAGKGSTAAYITSLMESQGIRCGLFHSPHVLSPLERIKIENKIIPVTEFIKQFDYVSLKMHEFCSKKKCRRLTYFELLFAIALNYFYDKKAKIAVIEVGLGGKLDPTNVIDGDIVVLTNIGLDHTKILGDTIEKIATDKVEIVKNESIVVSSFVQPSVTRILKSKIKNMDARLLLYGKQFNTGINTLSIDGTNFDYWSKENNLSELVITMPGQHQIVNAALAITAFLEFTRLKEIKIKPIRLRKSLKEAFMPGRIEVKRKEPLIIWDAAHNIDKMEALVETLKKMTDKRLLVLLAFKRGQKFEPMIVKLAELQSRVDNLVLAKYKTTQDIQISSEPIENYIDVAKEAFGVRKVSFIADAKKAYAKLLKNQTKDQIVLVTGSFYLLETLSN